MFLDGFRGKQYLIILKKGTQSALWSNSFAKRVIRYGYRTGQKHGECFLYHRFTYVNTAFVYTGAEMAIKKILINQESGDSICWRIGLMLSYKCVWKRYVCNVEWKAILTSACFISLCRTVIKYDKF